MKVGIYVGKIPPPNFIGQLIYNLSKKNIQIYLYGSYINNWEYSKNSSLKLRIFPKSKIKILTISIFLIIRLFFNQKYSFISLLKEIKYNSKNLKIFFIRCIKILHPINDNLDLLHVQWAKTIIFYPEIIKQIKCPVLLSLRGTQINVSPVINSDIAKKYNIYFPQITAFHAVSKAIALDAIKYGAEESKISIVYPAVKKKLLNYRNLKSPDKSNNPFKIISVGRCHWNKGFTVALDGLSVLMQKGYKFHYTLIADGKDYENIEFQINDLKLNNYVTFINGLGHKDVINEISNSNLLLLPSYQEGIANVVIEAMALGTLVISTNCGGMGEVIIDGLNGYLVPIRDSSAIVRSIINIMEMDSSSRIQIIDNAKKTILKNHMLDDQVNKISQIYSDILS